MKSMERNRISAETPWFDLFSRGARDWLRHNEKVRESVQQGLPDLVAQSDIITGPQDKTVQIPVRMLEHARFRLSEKSSQPRTEAGQGKGQAGDVLHPYRPEPQQDEEGQGGRGEGEVKLLLELQVDDIMVWLGEAMKLPDLQPKRQAVAEEKEYVSEG